VAIENGMDGAFGGHSRILRAPQWGVVLLEPDDQRLDLLGQLIGVAHRAPGAGRQDLEPVVLVTLENLVPGFAGDAEFKAHRAHLLAVQQAGNKAQVFVHNRHCMMFPSVPTDQGYGWRSSLQTRSSQSPQTA